jgi:hypothetical protein
MDEYKKVFIHGDNTLSKDVYINGSIRKNSGKFKNGLN